jgi:hypothetical protein
MIHICVNDYKKNKGWQYSFDDYDKYQEWMALTAKFFDPCMVTTHEIKMVDENNDTFAYQGDNK